MILTIDTYLYNKMSSQLQLIIGPMFAGKSTELIRQFKLHKFRVCLWFLFQKI